MAGVRVEGGSRRERIRGGNGECGMGGEEYVGGGEKRFVFGRGNREV